MKLNISLKRSQECRVAGSGEDTYNRRLLKLNSDINILNKTVIGEAAFQYATTFPQPRWQVHIVLGSADDHIFQQPQRLFTFPPSLSV